MPTKFMNNQLFRLSIALTFFIASSAVQASTITWTNTDGGTWSDASSWNPNQVPGPLDAAVITAAGTYQVALDADQTVARLTMGGSSGHQTLATGANNLTLNGPSTVAANGALALEGGLLGGAGSLTVQGEIEWTGGRMDTNEVLTLETNAVMRVEPDSVGSYLEFSGVMTNFGTIEVTNGGFRCIDYTIYGGGYGLLVNGPGGVIDLQYGSFIDAYNDDSGIGAPAIFNYGTILKSTGTDTNDINAPLYNSGTLDVKTGTVTLNGGGNGFGFYQAEAGATLAYPADYEVDGTVKGAGTNLLEGGILTLNGGIAGQFVWTSGRISTNSVCNVEVGGSMLVNPGLGVGGSVEFTGVLTNYGTIVLTNGGVRCIAYTIYGGGYGLLVNAPGGVIDMQEGAIIDYYDDDSGSGHPAVINYGTVLKSNGDETNFIGAPFYNSGTLDIRSGTVVLTGGGSGDGVFETEAGATLDFAGDFEVDSALTGEGTDVISAGNFILNGSLDAAQTVLTGTALLSGTNGVIAGRLAWNASARVAAGANLKIAQGGAVTVNPGLGAGSVVDFLVILG